MTSYWGPPNGSKRMSFPEGKKSNGPSLNYHLEGPLSQDGIDYLILKQRLSELNGKIESGNYEQELVPRAPNLGSSNDPTARMNEINTKTKRRMLIERAQISKVALPQNSIFKVCVLSLIHSFIISHFLNYLLFILLPIIAYDYC